MNKLKIYSFASALMLASAAGMTSCSSDSDVSGTGTSESRDVVKTQFAINVPRANGGTRATGAQTQGDGKTFLGMENIWLLGFNENPGDNSTSISTFPLTAISKDGNDAITENDSKKVYENVLVSTGTSHFVFYGFGAISDEKIGTFNNQLDLTSTERKKLSEISFSLKNINNVDYTADEPSNIIAALNTIDNKWPAHDEELNNVKTKFHTFSAGSAKSVCAMIQDMYDFIKVTYAQMPDALTAFSKAINDCKGFKVADDVVSTTLTFPSNLNLPDGAVSLTYTEGTGFSYKQETSYGAMNINPANITYPALLSYYTNTPIYTSTSKIANTSWPTTWDKDKFTGWTTDNAKVDANTKAIALSNKINYGVASLKLQVNCKDATLSQNDSEGETITVPTDGFEVTGLLIGNQPDEVDYKFAPKGTSFNKTIFDSKVSLKAKYNANSDANYTIVLPNQVAGETQQPVHFALELTNNSDTAFEGYDGIIEKGAKFYLVGTLSPESKTAESVTNPAVFMSDYQTEVTASISSLKNAYNTIPDIRTTNMQLGLSVDLTWKAGIKYDLDIGGDNN